MKSLFVPFPGHPNPALLAGPLLEDPPKNRLRRFAGYHRDAVATEKKAVEKKYNQEKKTNDIICTIIYTLFPDAGLSAVTRKRHGHGFLLVLLYYSIFSLPAVIFLF